MWNMKEAWTLQLHGPWFESLLMHLLTRSSVMAEVKINVLREFKERVALSKVAWLLCTHFCVRRALEKVKVKTKLILLSLHRKHFFSILLYT